MNFWLEQRNLLGITRTFLTLVPLANTDIPSTQLGLVLTVWVL